MGRHERYKKDVKHGGFGFEARRCEGIRRSCNVNSVQSCLV